MEGSWQCPTINFTHPRAQVVYGHCHGVYNLAHLQQHHPHPASCLLSVQEPSELSWMLLCSLLPALSHSHFPLSWGQDRLSLLLVLASSR